MKTFLSASDHLHSRKSIWIFTKYQICKGCIIGFTAKCRCVAPFQWVKLCFVFPQIFVLWQRFGFFLERLLQGLVQTDRQCLFILHGQPKDPEVIKVSWPLVHYWNWARMNRSTTLLNIYYEHCCSFSLLALQMALDKKQYDCHNIIPFITCASVC